MRKEISLAGLLIVLSGCANPFQHWFKRLFEPSGYVLIRGDEELVTEDFYIARFEMKNKNGRPVSKVSGILWNSVSRF